MNKAGTNMYCLFIIRAFFMTAGMCLYYGYVHELSVWDAINEGLITGFGITVLSLLADLIWASIGKINNK